MKHVVGVLLLLGALLGTFTATAAADDQVYSAIARGRYLAAVGDCTACHTKPGGKPFAGGLTIETPFGNLVSANITPDPKAGIGDWSDDDFVRSMQQGIAPGGKHLYPAEPYPAFTHVTREDLL
ncbi:MAG TPA: cytochrome c, partial [Polyangia bacterium]|nr:cytochrome c [Polyangia bacterium]